MAEAAALQASEQPAAGSGCRRAAADTRRNGASRRDFYRSAAQPYGCVHERLDEIGGGLPRELRATKLLRRVFPILTLLARPSTRRCRAAGTVRAALAAAMFARLALAARRADEGLSIGAVLWLAHELRTSDVWKERIICIVSARRHDRCFLDDVTTGVLHVVASPAASRRRAATTPPGRSAAPTSARRSSGRRRCARRRSTSSRSMLGTASSTNRDAPRTQGASHTHTAPRCSPPRAPPLCTGTAAATSPR